MEMAFQNYIISVISSPVVLTTSWRVRIITLITLVHACASSSLPVTVDNEWTYAGENATLSCNPSGPLQQLTWSKTQTSCTSPGSSFLVQYVMGNTPSFGSGVNTSHYQFDEVSYQLKVLSVILDDEGKYWCYARFGGQPDKVNNTIALIGVPPDPSTMFLTHDGMRYKHGDSISVTAGCTVAFSCTVPGIKPAAEIFSWTLGSTVLFPESDPTSVPNQVNSRLYDTTTSALTFTVPRSRMALMCAASNRQDGKTETESSTIVTLVIQGPPPPLLLPLPLPYILICVGVVLIIIGIVIIIVDYNNNKCKRTAWKIVGIILICVGVVLVIIVIVLVSWNKCR